MSFVWRASSRLDHATFPSSWARPAAILALITGVAVVVIVLRTVAQDPADFILMLACLFVLVFFTWFILSRRGRLRLLAVPAALFGLVGVVAVLGSHVLALVILIAALMLFGFSARYALRASRATARVAGGRARLVEPANRGVLIINPLSGGGKAVRFNLIQEARRRGVEPLLLGRRMDLVELAERAVDDGADVIGMAGGDGSQALLASVAMRRDVAHVCVPAGTRNHFALDLGLDRDDLIGALDAFTEGIERRVDLARVNDHVFVNNASLGLYASVVQSDAYRDAKLGTWRRLLPDMVGPGASSIDLQFEDVNAKSWLDATLVVVSNNPYQLRRFAGVGSRPELDTGRLGIFAARTHNARAVAKLVTLGTVGQSHRSRGLQQWASEDFEVRSEASVAVGLDGEAFLLSPPLRFVSLPGVLRVRLPRHAPLLSPAAAAVTLSRANLRALVKIAVGRRLEASPPERSVEPARSGRSERHR